MNTDVLPVVVYVDPKGKVALQKKSITMSKNSICEIVIHMKRIY